MAEVIGVRFKEVGKVYYFDPDGQTLKKEDKVIVEGINVVKKHVKPRKAGDPSGIIETEAAIYACKVQLVCPKCGEATRVGHKIYADGKKDRLCKKCGETF